MSKFKNNKLFYTIPIDSFFNYNIEDYLKKLRKESSFLDFLESIISMSKWDMLIFKKLNFFFIARFLFTSWNTTMLRARKLDDLALNLFSRHIGMQKNNLLLRNLKRIWPITPVLYNNLNFEKYLILSKKESDSLWNLYKKADSFKKNPRLFYILRYFHLLGDENILKTTKLHEQYMNL
jgi:hypothetical protein